MTHHADAGPRELHAPAPVHRAGPPATAATRHLDLDELTEAFARRPAAPRDRGTVELLVRRPAPGEREVLTTGILDPVVGLVGDDWSVRPYRRGPGGGPHPQMQLTLIQTQVVDTLADGDRARWPLAGDQLYVDLDLSPQHLPVGTRLGVGDEAVIEVTPEPHTGCAKLAGHFGRDALRWLSTPEGRRRNLRGIYTRVVVGGQVPAGAEVAVLDQP